MPELLFHVRWPDGAAERCYSPSLVIGDHLQAGATYPVDEFADRCRVALEIASERVRERYGFACTASAAQLAAIQARAATYAAHDRVTVERFEHP